MDELVFGVFIVLSIVIEAFHAPISDLIFALAEMNGDYVHEILDIYVHASRLYRFLASRC